MPGRIFADEIDIALIKTTDYVATLLLRAPRVQAVEEHRLAPGAQRRYIGHGEAFQIAIIRESSRVRAGDDAGFSRLETQSRLVDDACWIGEWSAVLFYRLVELGEGGIQILGLGNRAVFDEPAPEHREGVEHIDASSIAKVTALLVDAKIAHDQPAAGFELPRTIDEDPVPIRQRETPESFELLALRTYRVHVIADGTRHSTDPVHRGRGKTKVESLPGEYRQIKAGARRINMDIIVLIEIARDIRSAAVNQIEQCRVVVAR